MASLSRLSRSIPASWHCMRLGSLREHEAAGCRASPIPGAHPWWAVLAGILLAWGSPKNGQTAQQEQ